MRSIVRSSLALFGLSVAFAPICVQAQAPAGYAPAPTTMMGIDGKPVVVRPVDARMPAQSPMPAQVYTQAAPEAHKHRLRTLCAKCSKKQEMAMGGERIVGCAHSSNGVCASCRSYLTMPGTMVMAPAPGSPAEAPWPRCGQQFTER